MIFIGDGMGSILAFDAMCTVSRPDTLVSSPNLHVNPETPLTSPPFSLSIPISPSSPHNSYQSQRSCPEYIFNSISSNQLNSLEDNSEENRKKPEYLSLVSEQLEFNIAHFFSFGSLLGLLLASRKNTNIKSM